MNRSRLLFLAILNKIGFLGTFVVNGLSNALPLNGKTASELSDQYPNLFVPSGLTFSILRSHIYPACYLRHIRIDCRYKERHTEVAVH